MHLFLRIVINVTRLVIQCGPKFKREFENSFVVNELNSSQNWKQWTMQCPLHRFSMTTISLCVIMHCASRRQIIIELLLWFCSNDWNYLMQLNIIKEPQPTEQSFNEEGETISGKYFVAGRLEMFVEIRFQRKRLLTPVTRKVLRRWMCLHVRPKVRSVRKGFSTNIAGVRLVPRVWPEVPLEQPGSGESFATKLALVVEVVRQDVHGEGGHADVHLAADVTLLGVGRVQAPVSLPVPGEIAAGGVMFPTVGTSVLRLLHLVDSLFTPAIGYR